MAPRHPRSCKDEMISASAQNALRNSPSLVAFMHDLQAAPSDSILRQVTIRRPAPFRKNADERFREPDLCP